MCDVGDIPVVACTGTDPSRCPDDVSDGDDHDPAFTGRYDADGGRAWAAIVEPCTSRLQAYIRRVTSDADEANDLLAETLGRAWMDAPTLLGAAMPGDLLVNHARLVCGEWVSDHRQRTLSVRHLRSEAEMSILPDDAMSVEAATAMRDWANRVLARLSDKQRIAVDFHYRWGFSYEFIAQVLGAKPSTVRVHVHRGLRHLREFVREDPWPSPADD